jgi:hypothetical protein
MFVTRLHLSKKNLIFSRKYFTTPYLSRKLITLAKIQLESKLDLSRNYI